MVAKCDADKHRELGSRYGVTGFPTIKFFAKGNSKEAQDYSGPREEQDLVDFLNQKSGAKRSVTGELDDYAGRLSDLDAILKKHSTITESTKQELEAAVGHLSESEVVYGKHYIKVCNFLYSL